MNIRIERLRSQIKEELANYLLYETEDSLLRSVVITRVEITPDLQNLLVFFTTLEEGKEEEAKKRLESSKKEIRWYLAKNLSLRKVPDINFKVDKDLKYFEKIWQKL
ncbi:30S ribosome-binding factor RbfA [Thermocrinis minervae]|uniref:Ribosome-binding factor A n=1 Tax=Thermocrinis minervae TaxID=381751 RepID=A0A1M6THK5_9AQUI|nr:30S ribosome-binding factor RbfA [Thermocrinis minervae]SHK56447.1 ribosome-binding factor A [Thermocrinis minervae]